jgi:hypothetical protein
MRFSSTPFFSALGPLLFGRPPCSELKKLQAQAQGTDSISELRKALGQFVPDALFGQHQRGARQRLFTPLVTFWAFLSQVLSPESACRDAVRKAQVSNAKLNATRSALFATEAKSIMIARGSADTDD